MNVIMPNPLLLRMYMRIPIRGYVLITVINIEYTMATLGLVTGIQDDLLLGHL